MQNFTLETEESKTLTPVVSVDMCSWIEQHISMPKIPHDQYVTYTGLAMTSMKLPRVLLHL